MARITVEDCLQHVGNRFELVLIASKRARQLAKEGANPLIASKNDKPTVVALREIAENLINSNILEENKGSAKTTGIPEVASEISQEIIAETQTTVEESTQQAKSEIEIEIEAENK